MDGEGVSGESSSANQIENWIEEQDRLKRKLIVSDDFSWKLSSSVEFPQGSEMLKYVGGVDMSFSKEDPSVACACLVVLELPSLRVVHYDFSLLRLHVPYVAGFLAFREVTDGGFFFFFCRPDDTITMVIHYGGFMKKIEGEYMYVDECGCKTVQCKQSEVTWSHFKDFTVSEKINRSLNLIWFKKSSDEMYELDYTCDESDNPSNGCMFGVSWSELDVYLEHGNSLHEDIEDREGNDGDDERDNVGDQKEHSDCDEEDVDRPKEDKKPTTATTPIQRTTGQLFSPFTNRPFGFFMLQAPILVQLLQKMRDDQNPFYPQVLMVDGNGILHPRGFGLACHLGVLADLPTIGVGKNLYHVDGLNQSEVRRSLQVKGNEHEQVITLVGNSGITWGVGFRPTLSSLKPIYISVGHRISLDSAITIVKMTCKYRVPEPIRQADMRSREYIQKPKLSLSKELEQRRNVMDETEH